MEYTYVEKTEVVKTIKIVEDKTYFLSLWYNNVFLQQDSAFTALYACEEAYQRICNRYGINKDSLLTARIFEESILYHKTNNEFNYFDKCFNGFKMIKNSDESSFQMQDCIIRGSYSLKSPYSDENADKFRKIAQTFTFDRNLCFVDCFYNKEYDFMKYIDLGSVSNIQLVFDDNSLPSQYYRTEEPRRRWISLEFIIDLKGGIYNNIPKEAYEKFIEFVDISISTKKIPMINDLKKVYIDKDKKLKILSHDAKNEFLI